MREHIKAFLLTSSLAFGILGLTEAQRDQIFQILHEQTRSRGDSETLTRVAAILTPEQREKLALFQSQ